MSQPSVLALAGSTRRQSLNKQLLTAAAAVARDAGANVTQIDLRDFPLPIYDGDLEEEQGLPENADRLFQLFKSHDALLIASPEYNSSITPVLKNTIDWVSRPRAGEVRLAAFVDKVAGLLSASPGQLGGLRALVHVRAILGNIGVLVIPQQVAFSRAHEAFATDGSLQDQQSANRVTEMAEALVATARRLAAE